MCASMAKVLFSVQGPPMVMAGSWPNSWNHVLSTFHVFPVIASSLLLLKRFLMGFQ